MKKSGFHTGTVVRFDDIHGQGIIAPDGGGAEILIRQQNILREGYRLLELNQRVIFDIRQTPRGPEAVNCRPVKSE